MARLARRKGEADARKLIEDGDEAAAVRIQGTLRNFVLLSVVVKTGDVGSGCNRLFRFFIG